MDRKIGEVFYSELLHYYLEVIDSSDSIGSCKGCEYEYTRYCTHRCEADQLKIAEAGSCSIGSRLDGREVIFKKSVRNEFNAFVEEVKSIGLDEEEENALIELMRRAEEKSLLHMIDLLEKEKENGQVDR